MNLRLNKTFSVEMLTRVYNGIKNIESAPAGYPGEGNFNWNTIPIYSLGNEERESLPQTDELLDELKAMKLRLRLVRFMMLEPDGIIKEHSDSFLSDRIVRLHIPVFTNQNVEFFLDDLRCNWQPGELWFGDFSKPHHGVNKSQQTRVHLVIDVTVTKDLLKLFPLDSIPLALIAAAKLDDHVEIDTKTLSRFNCNFLLPKGFSLPGMGFLDLNESLKGSVRLIDAELCVLVNDQPLLKALALTEDKISLVGLPMEAYVDYVFSRENTVKSLALNIAGTCIDVELI
ncbi:aspartyl/asparaginyl beta-hydroxylase domain-containing protein [Pedobacter endophyticus]|uniref:Aspartyl/asparaginyl beta-hydroxylase domain-containing protein n=1 Tax=Pedobacter endophyticus TaxID=2789740 RepID=A0A7U3Q5Y9_9SPHI|nr:aspartyl/asparaginyl beta-hydroxylase domain-containing protein [Pedobacter endophyticus]QPH38255.1 aspartyl/asparaginyl beta-hydroxylase domain-containing protein [Pedobacter endophyticus]